MTDREIDALVHEHVFHFGKNLNLPHYTTDTTWINQLTAKCLWEVGKGYTVELKAGVLWFILRVRRGADVAVLYEGNLQRTFCKALLAAKGIRTDGDNDTTR